ncbi:DUF7534 family protein [Natrinema soli]|uniref:DUF7534 family protein n=1 Tax=Natrinema soli TaxID=1930624 RepID=UPI003CCD8F2D
MDARSFLQFFVTVYVLIIAVLMIAAVVFPPDPFAQIVYAAPMLLLVPLISYILTYKNGIAYLRMRL